MAAVNCPLCELRFPNRNERDWHLRNEHQHAHVHPPANRPAPWRPRHPKEPPAEPAVPPDQDEEAPE